MTVKVEREKRFERVSLIVIIIINGLIVQPTYCLLYVCPKRFL